MYIVCPNDRNYSLTSRLFAVDIVFTRCEYERDDISETNILQYIGHHDHKYGKKYYQSDSGEGRELVVGWVKKKLGGLWFTRC